MNFEKAPVPLSGPAVPLRLRAGCGGGPGRPPALDVRHRCGVYGRPGALAGGAGRCGTRARTTPSGKRR